MNSDVGDEIAAKRWNLLTPAEQQLALNLLYPELAPHGNVAAAIQAAAAELAAEVGTVTSGGLNPGGYAVVDGTTPDRRMQISIAVLERCLIFSGWSRGVEMVRGGTSDLGELVRIAAAWRRGASLYEMQETAPSVEVQSGARGHERGPAEYVAESWREMRQWRTIFGDDMRLLYAVTLPEQRETVEGYGRLADLIEAAYAVPVLRQLLPFTSMFWLTFSTCTGYPYDRSLPHIGVRQGGGYIIRGGRGVPGDDDNSRFYGGVIGEADDAESAIAIVVAHLPADIGPARAGTLDEP